MLSQPEIILSVNNVGVRYCTPFFSQASPIIDQLSFHVHTGKIVGIIGTNGSGKTTLITTLAGLILPTSGTIEFHTSRIRYVPDIKSPPPFMTADSFVTICAALCDIPAQEAATHKTVLYGQLNLMPYLNMPLSTLSKGTLQRVYLASALISKPHLLLLDEPFAGLDSTSYRLVRELLVSLKQKGLTLIICAHEPDMLYDDLIILGKTNSHQ